MPPLPQCEAWSEREVLNAEKEALGFYVTGHPLEQYAERMQGLVDTTTKELLAANTRADVTLGGMVTAVRQLRTRKGDAMAVIELEDTEGRAEVVIFPQGLRSLLPRSRARRGSAGTRQAGIERGNAAHDRLGDHLAEPRRAPSHARLGAPGAS